MIPLHQNKLINEATYSRIFSNSENVIRLHGEVVIRVLANQLVFFGGWSKWSKIGFVFVDLVCIYISNIKLKIEKEKL